VKYGDQRSGVEVRVSVGDGEVTIAVTNFGAGIAPEDLPRLFDRFMRSKMTRTTGVRGLGLGLYISKAIVEAHGGRMWVDSMAGQHTTFYFGLPAKAARLEAA
jgi:NtrC-family two-component system sensor histidine kinase KinB